MDLGLENKRVLVTGSTGGIGEGIAKRFAQEGAIVLINGRRVEEAERVAAEIRATGGQALVASGDLTRDDDVDAIVELAQSEVGGIDILVNNAASGEHQNDMETPASGWLDSYDANVLSMVRLIQRLLPPMKERGWGRIINISSAAGANPSPGMGVYSTTKAAVNNLTVTLAQGMSEDGVTINTVSPGAILTPPMVEMGLTQGMGTTIEEVEGAFNKMMGSGVPFPRMGSVDEVASVVVFLASSLASYVHGANIRVDGGWVSTVN
ncbi:MAG: SDR family NAD(P)-dependent oxidoreductase [Candidatus Promineifilaceae bacterium]|nr:SDR family NAD(P)-dependent oxidoreductase [Candidatus Promineifilaceae bacterium]